MGHDGCWVWPTNYIWYIKPDVQWVDWDALIDALVSDDQPATDFKINTSFINKLSAMHLRVEEYLFIMGAWRKTSG